jgi:hypothetical protein
VEIACLADVAGSYRRAGIQAFVLACFLRGQHKLQAVRAAAELPSRVARPAVPLPKSTSNAPNRRSPQLAAFR